MSKNFGFPTVLVAETEDSPRDFLVRTLQQQGYLVLEAQDAAEALEMVKVHSRPIDLMLTEGGPEGRTLAATLQQYRPRMSVVFVSTEAHGGMSFKALTAALTRVQDLVKPPKASEVES